MSGTLFPAYIIQSYRIHQKNLSITPIKVLNIQNVRSPMPTTIPVNNRVNNAIGGGLQ